jgi:anti-sigma B factor antagonist
MPQQGKLKVTEEDGITLVTFLEVAFLDETTIKDLGNELEALVKDKQGINLVINFANVDYLSSAVLGRLVKVYKMVTSNKGKIKLCGIKNNILQVFKITKLDKMFEIYPDAEKALKSFKSFKLFKK